MKLKKFLPILLFIISTSFIATVSPKEHPMPIFLGDIIEVQKDEQDNVRLLVKGYFKGCEIYEEELIALVTPETKISFGCHKYETKVNFNQGDKVYIEFSNIMTKSIPPQSNALVIQVSHPTN